MTNLIQSFAKNEVGKDYLMGDLHGHFTLFEKAIEEIGFDVTKDRMFSVGDLVDRGPESIRMPEFVAKPWFHAVVGNHELGMIEWEDNLRIANGQSWFIGLSTFEQADFRVLVRSMPLAIEVETDHGLVGIVHAEVPYRDWEYFKQRACWEDDSIVNTALWTRSRWREGDRYIPQVTGVDKVVVGHTPQDKPRWNGNVLCIDTGCGKGGHLTILDLSTMKVVYEEREY